MLKNKYSNAGISYIIASLLNSGVNFLTIPIFTRILSTNEYGIYNTFISYVNIGNVIIGLGLFTAIRSAYIDHKTKYLEFLNSITVLMMIFTGLLLFIVILLFEVFSINKFLTSLTLLGLLQSFSIAVVQNQMMYHMMKFEFKTRTILIALPILVVNFSSIIAIIFIFEDKLFGRIVVTSIIYVIIAIFIIVLNFRKVRFRIYYEHWVYALRISLPLVFHGLSLTILSQSDRILITNLYNATETAIYSLVYNLGMLSRVFVTAMEGIWVPWFSANLEKRKHNEINKKMLLYIDLINLITIGVIYVSPELIKLIAPKEYWGGIMLSPIIVFSSYIIFLYTFYVNVEHHHKNTRNIASSTLIAAFLNIILNIIFIPKYGALGASLTTLFSYLVSFAIHYIVAKKLEPEIAGLSCIYKSFLPLLLCIASFYLLIKNFNIRVLIFSLYSLVQILRHRIALRSALEATKS